MKHRLRANVSIALLLGLLALISGTGCVRAITIDIPHPLTRGLVPNRIASPDTDTAAYYTLPMNTFQHEGSMVALDAQRVCFAVTLRADGQHGELASLSSWRVFLRGDPNIEIMSPIFGPPTEQSVVPMMGTVPRQVYAGTYNQCTRYSYGMSCTPQPRYVTVREPALINVVAGGGSVCFAHGGAVNPGTRQLTLHLDDPNNVARRVAFRWNLLP